MSRLAILRESMMQWKVFLTACIFVGGLLLKVGAPAVAVALGIALAAAANWAARRGAPLRAESETLRNRSRSAV